MINKFLTTDPFPCHLLEFVMSLDLDIVVIPRHSSDGSVCCWNGDYE